MNSQSAYNRSFIFVEHSHSAVQKYIGNIFDSVTRRQYQPHRTSLETHRKRSVDYIYAISLSVHIKYSCSVVYIGEVYCFDIRKYIIVRLKAASAIALNSNKT